MANSKARCAGCRQYKLRSELTRVGLSSVCSDSEECRRALLDRHKQQTEKKVERQAKREQKARLSSRLRKSIRKRDGACRFCGEAAYRMEVHHITYRSQGGPDTSWNLILLCDEHHRLVHTNKRRWQPVLRAVIWAHYVEGRRFTVPQMERRLKREGLVVELDDGLPDADE